MVVVAHVEPLQAQLDREHTLINEFSSFSDSIAVYMDENLIIRYFIGDKLAQFLHLSPEQFLNRPLPEVLRVTGAAEDRVDFFTKMVEEVVVSRHEKKLRHQRGQGGYLQFHIVPSQSFSGIHVQIEDISELMEVEGKVVQQLNEEKKALEKRRATLELKEKALINQQQIQEIEEGFMGMLHHELRSPMANIQTSVDILRRHYDQLPSEKVKAHIQTVYSHVLRMRRMLTDLRSLDVLQSVNFENNPSLVNVEEVVLKLYEHSPYHLELQVDHDFVLTNQVNEQIMVDPFWFECMLHNLIDNAIKYTPDKGKIFVTTMLENGFFVFEVTDTGIGVPEAERSSVFRKLFRADNARKFRLGSGLGLAQVKECAEKLGGSIEYRPNATGVGSTFRLKVPIAE
jgi:signal transduction histidine kinase